MNIFILDYDIENNVKMYVDKHVVKMPTETAQILCSTYHVCEQSELANYKLTHKNHPSCIWARESLSNWKYLRELGIAISKEYTYRYGKVHKCQQIMEDMTEPNIADIGFTTPPKCMPEEVKLLDVENSYINYYNKCKSHIFSWKNRDIPYFATL